MNSSENSENLTAKAVIIGDPAVGKTSIKKRYFGTGFHEEYIMTLGAGFSVKKIHLDDNRVLKLNVWDLAGQESFNQVRPVFYKGTSALILVFDLTNQDSFQNLEKWVTEFWSHSGSPNNIPVILVGNKLDLLSKEPKMEDYKEFWKKFQSIHPQFSGGKLSIFTSAKTGVNINEMFDKLKSMMKLD